MTRPIGVGVRVFATILTLYFTWTGRDAAPWTAREKPPGPRKGRPTLEGFGVELTGYAEWR